MDDSLMTLAIRNLSEFVSEKRILRVMDGKRWALLFLIRNSKQSAYKWERMRVKYPRLNLDKNTAPSCKEKRKGKKGSGSFRAEFLKKKKPLSVIHTYRRNEKGNGAPRL